MMADIIKQEPSPEEMTEGNTYSFPNPAGGLVTIRFCLPAQRDVNIGIYDLKGGLVRAKRLNAAETNMGENFVVWDLKNDQGIEAANGVYVLEIQSGGKEVRKKIAVIK